MDREQEKEKARRRRNDVKRVRDNTRRWMKAIWRESLIRMRLDGKDAEEWLDLQVAMRERTATPCSCELCKCARKTVWGSKGNNGLTFQERRFLDAWDDEDGSVS